MKKSIQYLPFLVLLIGPLIILAHGVSPENQATLNNGGQM